MRRVKRKMSDRTPEMKDPCWERWTLPIIDMLSEARDWRYLEKWASLNRFGGDRLRHSLAWLEEKGFANCWGADVNVRWRRTILGAQFLAKQKTLGHTFWECRAVESLPNLTLDGLDETALDEGGVLQEEAARNLRDDLAFLRRDGVLGEEALLVDGRLDEARDERLLESGIVGVGEEYFAESELSITVKKANGRLKHPPKIEKVEKKMNVRLGKTAT